jgi:tRNA 5-methylaminomethyl-2-thiouridine biosynthesis bifunctional protein
MPLEPAELSFNIDGLLLSSVYDDVYHSAAGAHEQAHHVFLAGNGLPARWRGRPRFTIVETGFGIGVNFLATWLAWQGDAQRCLTLDFVSFEKHPFSAADLALALSAWPEFVQLADELRGQWPALEAGEHRLSLDGGRVRLTLHFGDATTALPRLDTAVDAFYLDGFSPARNPELWSPELLLRLASLAACGATLATWTVAGSVRRSLMAAGFAVEKRPGFAGKRQMLVGRYAQDDFSEQR